MRGRNGIIEADSQKKKPADGKAHFHLPASLLCRRNKKCNKIHNRKPHKNTYKSDDFIDIHKKTSYNPTIERKMEMA